MTSLIGGGVSQVGRSLFCEAGRTDSGVGTANVKELAGRTAYHVHIPSNMPQSRASQIGLLE